MSLASTNGYQLGLQRLAMECCPISFLHWSLVGLPLQLLSECSSWKHQLSYVPESFDAFDAGVRLITWDGVDSLLIFAGNGSYR